MVHTAESSLEPQEYAASESVNNIVWEFPQRTLAGDPFIFGMMTSVGTPGEPDLPSI